MAVFERKNPVILTSYSKILNRTKNIEPVKYSSTRNYINGSVTYLSPYISRGVISTKLVLTEVLNRGYKPDQIEKFIQELAWRDYWQQIWIAKGNSINQDIKHEQIPVSNTAIPTAIINASTGIDAIDKGINDFYKTGYLHNHLRMYIASITCNIAQSHWKEPAKWMYYNLLDADWASNALSWQWVSGANSNKKYVANQDNINKYCFTKQQNSFLDVSYESLNSLNIPQTLTDTSTIELNTPLPKQKKLSINTELPSYIYNFYNLDPLWNKETEGNRILLIEPSVFAEYPISQNSIDFMLKIAKENILNIQIYIGEFNDLMADFNLENIHYKEHPLNNHYKGVEEPREWMFDVKGYHSSFFSFWKKCKKQLAY